MVMIGAFEIDASNCTNCNVVWIYCNAEILHIVYLHRFHANGRHFDRMIVVSGI